MERKTYDRLFIAGAIILVGLVGSLNCLQGTPFIGGLKCDYALTSTDTIIKIGAAAIFALFLVLFFGPILAAIAHKQRTEETRTTP
ncbi:MAG TPA: hypothetical protein VLV31_00195 [Candidatus Acidoferrales bacterium]|nr:hypothetical protein [Candidatus Acidoferrales bacterium]